MSAVDNLREEVAKLVFMARKSSAKRDDSTIASVLENIDANLTAGYADDAIPELASLLLDGLLNIGLPDNIKLDIHDVEFIRKRNGDRKLIGMGAFSNVFLARMRRRDGDGDIIAGEYVEVAVKQFTILRARAQEIFPQFMRRAFLQKITQHPCIVQTYGGHWPTPEEIEDEDEVIEPVIVMERMTTNLRDVLYKGLLNSIELKKRVLGDIAAGIEHLHSRGIVHRDIKPENVLLRIVDGEIEGRTKLCGFDIARKAEETGLMADSEQVLTRPTGSSYYMPPEAFLNTARESSNRARDVWSYGVLMCEVLQEGFLANLLGENRDASRTDFARKMVEHARNLPCEGDLRRIVCSCLFVDPACRQRIEYISARIPQNIPDHQFTFYPSYTKEFRAKQVLAYFGKVFTVGGKRNNLETAISVLEKIAKDGTDSSARSVLGYCYYWGIGVGEDKKKAEKLFQKGCDSGDVISMYALGVIHCWAKRYESAVSMWTKAAEQGSTEAMRRLAVCYRFGYGVKKDWEESFTLMSCAAEGDNQHAQVQLADYYREGIGTKKDGRRGFDILQRLCANGNGYAALNLAFWYRRGWVMEKDEEKAKELFALADKRGIHHRFLEKSPSNEASAASGSQQLSSPELLDIMSGAYLEHPEVFFNTRGCAINPQAIEFMRKPNGDRKFIGKGNVYHARMKYLGENGESMRKESKDVAATRSISERGL